MCARHKGERKDWQHHIKIQMPIIDISVLKEQPRRHAQHFSFEGASAAYPYAQGTL